MVLPEGTGRHGEGRSTSRRALFVGAVLLVALGFVVLGGLSSSDDPTAAVETTTTTALATTTTDQLRAPIDLENFSVEQLETGPQLEWQQAAIDDIEGYPIALLDNGNQLFLFGVATSDWDFSSRGLLAWRSSDGLTWESLGQVISDDYVVERVEATSHGLVAAGTTSDRSQIMVWTSPDGQNWSPDQIAVDTEHPHMHPFISAVGANGDALVVVTNVEFDGHAMLEERLAEAGHEVDLDMLGWEMAYRGADGAALHVRTPLGLTGIEIPLDELELTEEEEHWVQNGYDATPDIRTFTRRTASIDWTVGQIEGPEWIERIVFQKTGTMLLTGWSGMGSVTLRSEDGVRWAEDNIDAPSNWIYEWRDGLIAVDDSPRNEVLYRRETGSDWEPLGLIDHFPVEIQWNTSGLGTGPGGLIVAMHGYRSTGSIQESPDPVELTTDEGHIVSIDFERAEMSIETDGVTHTWSSYRDTAPEGISVDLEARAITLSNPETGEPLTELSFDDLREAENAYYTHYFVADEHVVIAFTEDGSEWTIQATSSAFGQNSSIGRFAMGSDRVTAVVVPDDQTFSPYGDFEFEVWVADIP